MSMLYSILKNGLSLSKEMMHYKSKQIITHAKDYIFISKNKKPIYYILC